jgi:hypothetical protein
MHSPLREKRIENIARADTVDLLDRVTAYRQGMEREAIELIEEELRKRGVNRRKIEEHQQECERTCLFTSDGIALKCSLCRRPAVVVAWGWHRMLGKIPIFPRRMRWCADHQPQSKG